MNLLGSAGDDLIKGVIDFITEVFSQFVAIWFWPFIVLGLYIVSFFVMVILINHSYENRILKSINKINIYFLSKPFITDENLVEFNLKMKKVPKVLRNNWQIFMLNREDGPSAYINSNTCIDKPLRTSSIEKNMNNYTIFTIFLTLFAFVSGLQETVAISISNSGSIFFRALIVPLAIVLIFTVTVLFMRWRKNDIYSCMYDNFPLFERNLTKAVSTLPSYVDYEILFTKKEIKEGIPILQQYLEKRALIEQQELEKARENSTACEEYNFDELGIDGSLVLERAMKECETFIKARRRLQEECDQIEAEKENYKKNFETTEKDFQRKLQASRENLESLKAQQEASTNRIESNYIKKQQGDEIKKQEQLEKDSEEATAKFNEEQVTLEQEIEKRKQEIDEKKIFIQQAMLLEFKHYANTLFKALAQKASELGNQKLMNLAQENADLKGLLNDLQGLQMGQPSIQDGLIQNEELANQNLYSMQGNENVNPEQINAQNQNGNGVENNFNGEMNNMQNNEANVQIDNNGQNVGIENQEMTNINENVNANNQMENANINENMNTSFENAENNLQNSNVDNDGNNNGNASDSTNGNDDGGQVFNQNVENVEKTEDLDALQKQIEEESANLQKQKQELANDLNKTISQMDNTNNNVSNEQIPNSNDNIDNQVANNQNVENFVQQENNQDVSNQETINQNTSPTNNQDIDNQNVQNNQTEVNEQNNENVSARRTSSRTSSRGGRASRSSGSSSRRANSEIDALNAEMEKLLDSNKK